MLNPRLAELEELAAIGQASAQHAEYHYEAQLRSADELELAQREELMRLRARLSSDEPAVYSERQALETAFRTELDASEARATAAHQATSATLALTKRDAEHSRRLRYTAEASCAPRERHRRQRPPGLPSGWATCSARQIYGGQHIAQVSSLNSTGYARPVPRAQRRA